MGCGVTEDEIATNIWEGDCEAQEKNTDKTYDQLI